MSVGEHNVPWLWKTEPNHELLQLIFLFFTHTSTKTRIMINANDYINEFRYNGTGFEEFSDDAILYAILEYSRFPRNYSQEGRIVYMHNKCLEYLGKDRVIISVEFDPQYNSFEILYPQTSPDLPF